jgi:hypothetical protein
VRRHEWPGQRAIYGPDPGHAVAMEPRKSMESLAVSVGTRAAEKVSVVPSEEHELLAERLPGNPELLRQLLRDACGWEHVRAERAASPAVPVVRQRARTRMRVSGSPRLVGLEGVR